MTRGVSLARPTTRTQSGTVDNCIAKADATVVVTAYSVTYESNPHTATYTISGVNGEAGATVGTVNVSGTTHTGLGRTAAIRGALLAAPTTTTRTGR